MLRTKIVLVVVRETRANPSIVVSRFRGKKEPIHAEALPWMALSEAPVMHVPIILSSTRHG